MKKLKDSSKQEKLHFLSPLEKICFSFEKMSSNKNYSFNSLAKGIKETALQDFVDKLKFFSSANFSYFITMSKNKGFESIPYNQLSESVKQICDGTSIITHDSKLIVFRFGNGKYRAICKNDTIHSNLLYIIACDFDFSAYNH